MDPTVLKNKAKETYHRTTTEILRAHQTVTFALNVEVQIILQKIALNIPNRIHLTLVARIVVYFIKTDSAKTKGKDIILENKDTRNREALPNPDTPVHHTLDKESDTNKHNTDTHNTLKHTNSHTKKNTQNNSTQRGLTHKKFILT